MELETRAELARAERRANISMRIEMATLSLCLEHGIEAVTVEQVAAAADISRRTFYRYFDTIDDVLCAMPRRSLEKWSEAFKNRPLSERVFEAFIQVARNRRISEDERSILILAEKVARRSNDPWWRAMNRMQPSAHDIYSGLIEQRLRALGEDPQPAGLIAAVLQSVIGHAAQESVRKGSGMPEPEDLEQALRTLAGIIQEDLKV